MGFKSNDRFDISEYFCEFKTQKFELKMTNDGEIFEFEWRRGGPIEFDQGWAPLALRRKNIALFIAVCERLRMLAFGPNKRRKREAVDLDEVERLG